MFTHGTFRFGREKGYSRRYFHVFYTISLILNVFFFPTGWGDLSEGSEIDGDGLLMEVDLPIIGMKHCQEAYSQGKLIRPITKEQICAAYDQGGKDTCQVT